MNEIYSNNKELNSMIETAVSSIESNAEMTGLVAMIKNAPTGILKASKEHKELRYRPGERLVTYNGIDEHGELVKETYGGGVAVITEDSVILRNPGAIKFPQFHEMFGKEVRGTYNNEGIFLVDPFQGEEELHNEYVSDVGFVKGAYGIEATTTWQTGFKLQPSYVMKIPEEMDSLKIITKSNIEINLQGGDFVVIDAKKGKVTSVHGVEKTWLKNTYIPLEEHLKSLQR